MFVSLFALSFYLFLICIGQYPAVFDKTDHSDTTVYCDEFDLKNISNMTETPKIIIIGKIALNFHKVIFTRHVKMAWKILLGFAKKKKNVLFFTKDKIRCRSCRQFCYLTNSGPALKSSCKCFKTWLLELMIFIFETNWGHLFIKRIWNQFCNHHLSKEHENNLAFWNSKESKIKVDSISQ